MLTGAMQVLKSMSPAWLNVFHFLHVNGEVRHILETLCSVVKQKSATEI